MGTSKIVNESEVKRWFEQGKTYQWMTEQYREKYNIEMGLSAWGNLRRRRGWDRRIARDDDLIPWEVKPEHRHSYPVLMLRREARRRAGMPTTERSEHQLDAWLAGLERDDVVVHYEPDTEQGWFYVPRRPGIDTDLIRRPERKTTQRPAAD